jgi:hypothetical protein
MAALSQLSYSPDEVEVACKVNTCCLLVARRSQTELYRPCPGKSLGWKKKASIKFAAICAEDVDFRLAIGRPDIAAGGESARTKMHDRTESPANQAE